MAGPPAHTQEPCTSRRAARPSTARQHALAASSPPLPCGRYPPVWHVGVAERVLLTPTERAPKQQQESGRALRAAEQRRHTHTRRPVGSVLTRRAKCTDLARKAAAAHTPARFAHTPVLSSSIAEFWNLMILLILPQLQNHGMRSNLSVDGGWLDGVAQCLGSQMPARFTHIAFVLGKPRSRGGELLTWKLSPGACFVT